jgi:hypothetical protein
MINYLIQTMTKKTNATVSLILILTLLFSGCETWIDPEMRIDPDRPYNVDPAVILPAAQSELAFMIGGFAGAGAQGIWTQQVLIHDRSSFGSYYLRPDVDDLWDAIYTGYMMDIKSIIEAADAAGDVQFAGVGRVLMALALGNATDVFGEIPYTEAFKGGDNPTPTFDSQQSIYSEIIDLLDKAITDLGDTDLKKNKLAFGADYYYDGNFSAWQKAAYTLRARNNLHLHKVRTADYNAIIADVDAGMQTIADDMEQPFGTGENEWNPLYNFSSQRRNYVGESTVFEGFFMDDTIRYGVADPRAGIHRWGSGPWTSSDSPVALCQSTEGQFIKAEAHWRLNRFMEARITLKGAVAMAMDKINVDISSGEGATWKTAFDADVDATAGADLLEIIMTQKYLHMYMQPEAFSDWRRTGFPQLIPYTGTEIPRRFPYGSEEIKYNPNVPDYGSIFDRVWWDAEE